ncbi:MAG: hypothetical protein ACI4C1_03955 [Lachnospiraceae bacterium]
MSWISNCIKELRRQKLFQNRDHEELFRDTVECYKMRPFFSAGLCKCIYLASWDMEHFAIFLEPINQMVLRGDTNLDYMKELGVVLAEENEGQSQREMYIYQLSEAFLEEIDFVLPKEVEESGEDWILIYHNAKRAAQIIDRYYRNK